ncbi:IniB N-terminal domain-containing protein [Agromyces sp. NPDC055520]
MSTPVATIADALIAFILSLLRDPAAVEEFHSSPQAVLADHGLQNVCGADVKAVAPVIVDNAAVTPKPPGTTPVTPDEPDEVINEINRIINQFTTIDNRTTLIDQSVNQNIWADGDVTQIFDQDAVVASGDDAVAAGDDATVDDSDTTITTGDISVGNTIGSGNTTTTDAADDAPDDAAPVEAAPVEAAPIEAVAVGAVAESLTTDAPAPEQPAPVEDAQPDALMADLTAADSYDTSEPLTAPEPEPYPEDAAEEQ